MLSVSAGFQSLVDELAGIIEALPIAAPRRPRFVLVERAGSHECYRLERTGPVLVARGDLGDLARTQLPREVLSEPVEFRLDGSRVLSKVLHLPAASRQYLDAIVAHQVERATPWAADRVVFDYVLGDEPPPGSDQIAVRLVATSRDVFDAALERLAAAGLTPDVVGTSEDPVDQPSAVNLARGEKSGRSAALRRAVVMGLGAVAVLAVLSSSLAAWRLYSVNADAAALQAEMSRTRQAIEAAMAGRELSESRAALLARKRQSMPAVLLLERLSSLIPFSTYLTELTMDGEELRLAGLSSDAPTLIGMLEEADFLDGVRFAGPTIRDDTAAQDRFEILARIVGPEVETQ
jgi:general secretion pathway protein L